MQYSLKWQEVYKEPLIILLVFIIVYVIYHYWLNAENIIKHLKASDTSQQKSVFLQRILGGLLLGVIPAIISRNPSNYGLNTNNILDSVISAGILIFILLPVLYLSSKNPKQQAIYPQIKTTEWTSELFFKSVGGWIIYLTGYEFLFRGFLLFPLAEAYGSWPAIIIITSLYVLAHINKTAGETIGCIPIGVIFGLMALNTGSILGPLIAHIFIASLSELFAVINNPSMNFVKK